LAHNPMGSVRALKGGCNWKNQLFRVRDRPPVVPLYVDAPGGDAYMLKRVLHDWDDERAGAILRNCHRAMPAHGRLLVIELVLPPGNAPSRACQGITIPTKQKRRSTGPGAKKPLNPQRPEKRMGPR